MVKTMDGKCPKNWTQIVKCLLKLSVAKTACMYDYVKPLVRSSPDHFILHVGSNELSSDKSPEVMARSIIDLATSIKNEKHVSISNILICAIDKKLEEKRREVNSFLGKLCKEKSLRTSNPDKLVFAHLNRNSIRNKFEMLLDQIKGNIDVLLVSETKIDDSFPIGNFLINEF